MTAELLTATQAAERLGVTVTTLYGWLAESDLGLFVLRGAPVTISYFQSGRQGQGRIRIEAEEVERLKELMLVRPRSVQPRRSPIRRQEFPLITVRLGRPD